MLPQTNLVDLQKIHRIPPDLVEIIQQTLGLPTPHVPLGLLGAANEILVGSCIAPICVAWPTVPSSDTAHWANCEVLSHVAQGPPSLVAKQKGISVLPFTGRLCATFPHSRIVVTVANKRTGIQLVNMLRSQGHDCWFFDGEYKIREDHDWPDHRIKVVLEDMLFLCSLELHLADIVLVTDAARFVTQKIFGFGVETLFDLCSGTHFKEDVRLIGIIDEELPLKNMREVWSVFGLKTYILNPQGEAYLAPRVTWVTRSKQDRSLFASGLTHETSNLQKMRCLVWENNPRNQSVLKIARKISREARNYAFVQDRYAKSVSSPVGIVVENLRHRKVLVEAQSTKEVRIPVFVFDEIEERDNLPSFLVRADAGTGLLPVLPQEHGIWVVDLQDQTSKYLSRRVRLRQKAYLKACHIGETPFLTKWLGAPTQQYS